MLDMIPKPSYGKPQGKSAGMDTSDLQDLLQDIENQPDWRTKADKCAAYYDGKQMSGALMERMAKTGEPMTVVNLIGRTVNGALGNEAKSRLDWKASADGAAFSDVADVVSEQLHEAGREAKANVAISEAYKSMLVGGIGWVEVSKSPSPLQYPYRAEHVHRNEVWWDFRSRFNDLRDAKWVCRQRWVDLDEAEALLPEHKETFRLGCYGSITEAMEQITWASETFADLDEKRRSFNRFQEEWLDNSARKRVRFYDVHYKVWRQVTALVAGKLRVPFNPANALHVMLVRRGLGELVKGPDYVIRRAMFAGPYRLFDEATTLRRFPLIPFVCYRDDEDGTPYGLVHGMIDPQDEYNERRSRLRWLLKAKQVYVDNDALDLSFNSFKDLALEVMRPDGFFVLNANRRNANGLKVEQNLQMSAEQTAVMNDAKQLIQEVPGIYNAMLGNNSDGVKSGVALNSLVEQSIVSLGEANDNYREGRQMVGEALVDLIVSDLSRPNMPVEVGSGKKRRVIVLNTVDQETGMPINTVAEAPVKVGLADVPSTPAYRMQVQQQIALALNAAANDPDARAVLIPSLLETMDLEHGAESAKWLRQKYGVPQPGEAEDDGAEQQMQAQAQQTAAVGQELQMRALTADVAKKEAEAAKATAEVEAMGIDIAKGQQELQQAQQPSEEELAQQAIAEAMAEPL